MKVLARTLSVITLVAVALFLVNCGPDDDKTPAEKAQLAKLAKTWKLANGAASATLEGSQAEQILSNFTITFGGTFNSQNPKGPYTFSVTGTDDQSPWPVSGTWSFADDVSGNSGTIARHDTGGDVGINYSLASNGQLTLTFHFTPTTGYPGSKLGSVSGDWVFVLIPA